MKTDINVRMLNKPRTPITIKGKPPVIVCSLPRTGTLSLCSMLETLQYRAIHVPGENYERFLTVDTASADTPCFAPSVVEKMAAHESSPRFIYIDRDFSSWYESMDNVPPISIFQTFFNHSKQRAAGSLTGGALYDNVILEEVLHSPTTEEEGDLGYFEKCFNEHKELMLAYSPLVYKFSDGWEPLCEFLGMEVPNEELPRLHERKNK